MTEIDNAYVEKRKDKRITIDCDVVITDLKEDYNVTGKCCNYSQSGILLKVHENLRVGTEVSIKLLDDNHKLEAVGDIVRIVRNEKIYLTAIIFK